MDLKELLLERKAAGKPVGFCPWRDRERMDGMLWGYLLNVGSRDFTMQEISALGQKQDVETYPLSRASYFDFGPIYTERLIRLEDFKPTFTDDRKYSSSRALINSALEEAFLSGEVLCVKTKNADRHIARVIGLDKVWCCLMDYDDLMRERIPFIYRRSMIEKLRWRTASEESDLFLLKARARTCTLGGFPTTSARRRGRVAHSSAGCRAERSFGSRTGYSPYVRWGILLAAMVAPVLGRACYNDRDTLGFELRNKPDIQRALTGRFDRFPPLYYTMRVDRLRAKPSLLPDEYDDMAVALGRLGRNEEALAALAAKARLPHLTNQDQYRLFANRGTIRAHKWIADGAKKERLADLKAAASDIETAIKLNSKAHFGREGAQLEVIRWLIALNGADPRNFLGDWLLERRSDADYPTSLAGLIMLGGAWESPDVASAIGFLEWRRHRYSITEFACCRYKELVKLGRKPFDPSGAEQVVENAKAMPKDADGDMPVAQRFKLLRTEAEEWHANKTSYMMGWLKQGRHPDTDPAFWNGWKEPPMPVVPDFGFLKYTKSFLSGFGGLIGVVVLAMALLILRDRLKKKA